MLISAHQNPQHKLRAAIAAMDAKKLALLASNTPDILRVEPEVDRGGWLGEALHAAFKQSTPFHQLRPMLEVLSKCAYVDTGGKPALKTACELSLPQAFLWLVDQGYSLDFKETRAAWMRHTLKNPGWIDEGKLLVSLRKKRSGAGLPCDALALALLSGRPEESLRRAWCGGLLGDVRPVEMALRMGNSMKDAFAQQKDLVPCSKQWSVDPRSWEFLCVKVGESALTARLPSNALEEVLSAMYCAELHDETPICASVARKRF